MGDWRLLSDYLTWISLIGIIFGGGISRAFAYLSVPFGRSQLQIRFCDRDATIVDASPPARFWRPNYEDVIYFLDPTYVRLSNFGNAPVTIDRSWFELRDGRKLIDRKECLSLVGLRLDVNDTNSDAIEVHCYARFTVNASELAELVGLSFRRVRMDLVVKSGNKTARVRFRTERFEE